MAEETDLEIEETGGSKKKLIIIIAAAVLVLGGVAGFFLFSGSDAPEESLAEETTASEVKAEQGSAAQMGSALYVAMPRPFVFNVPGASRDRIVQIKVQLLVRGDVNEEVAKKHIPLIEGTLLSVFSTTTADELSTSAGKETLRLTALDKVQAAMEGVEGSKVIERVLFTGFVMQ
ncbi:MULTISPECIES: flagellar basal body-associated protein FliL [Pseudoalteromonas]|uniref:Flagellar protein FliL n=2 Tax=Pseudoalteromonas TaxID=53246 RepID=A0A8I2H2G2_9GAMM|nr:MULTISPECIES: flagellar basal body-associated protein FliL [Pseudoalteromonas]ASD67459.1 flagellar basal body-associated protein FliL [Pseudoalteromonas piscicida]AXQ98435.1 flagellar basal body-associated protein FliL [Pseudoalteromonas piscicida]AXR01840.1 flagellar basal body-associated protein FliL [Pseudoalteromonas piscicida]KID38151.1 flagellar basal body-associated protein FliL [Pseudoalteromonas flavipulchra NCIMB 2033 = ATCC BAA-314]KJZ02093.1 flagellar basal body-associated prote